MQEFVLADVDEIVRHDLHLGAEEVLAAEKEGRKIAVEIKSFIGPSQMQDLEQALGQFVLYRVAMRKEHPDRCSPRSRGRR